MEVSYLVKSPMKDFIKVAIQKSNKHKEICSLSHIVTTHLPECSKSNSQKIPKYWGGCGATRAPIYNGCEIKTEHHII